MNSLGLNIILRMGCLYCSKQTVHLHTRTLTVREHLAEGGFSTVSLVEDTKTHLLYALKRIPCHSLADQHVAMQEVEAHKTLENVPGIIQMVDYDLKGRVDPLEDWRGDNESGEVWILFGYFRVRSNTIFEAFLKVKKNLTDSTPNRTAPFQLTSLPSKNHSPRCKSSHYSTQSAPPY